MANFSSLKQAIETYIKQNGNKEITGALLQSILLSMVTTIGDGAVNDLESDVSDINSDIVDINGALTASVQFTGGSLVFKNANDTVLYSIAVSTFLDGIVARLNSGAVYAGYAAPSTTPDTLAGQKVFYVATQAGTYIHFLYNGDTPITLAKDGIYFIVSGAGADDWNAEPIQQFDDVPTPNSNNPIKSGAVLRSIIQDGSAFDLSAHNAVGGVLATYADLSEALTALNSLDAVYKQPGMSFRFVQSNDNNYVQFRCIANEFTTDVTKWAICDDGIMIENPEFSVVLTDKKKSIIVAAEKDGNVYFGFGVPKQIVEFINNSVGKDIDEILAFLEGFPENSTLKQYLDSFYGKYIENPDFLSVLTDKKKRIIAAIKPDGDVFFGYGCPSQIQEYIENYIYSDGNSIVSFLNKVYGYYIEDPENRMDILTDSKKRIISYRDEQGILHENVGIELSKEGLTSLAEDLKKEGVGVTDWSKNKELHIKEPRCAIVNFTNISGIPQTKNANVQGIMEFWDMQGNYFKKEVIMNAQGRSTMQHPKKNIAIDICNNNDWDDDDTFTFQIGNWVPQDSFHLKAFYNDPFRCLSPVAYKLNDEILKTRGEWNDYVWKRALLDLSSITATSTGCTDADEAVEGWNTGARCFPMGFPCIVYLNGEFYGIYSWQLKKHRDNYMMSKKKTKHIHLDGIISLNRILNANGDTTKIWWTTDNPEGIEIRNPKPKKKKDGWDLVLMDGTKYDADANGGEIMSPTMIVEGQEVANPNWDETNTSHTKTYEVKQYILNLSKVLPTISAAYDVYEASGKTAEDVNTFKAVFETYFDVPNLIDYMILSDVLNNYDGMEQNVQWITYNGVKWYLCAYDLDGVMGNWWQLDNTITAPRTQHFSDIQFAYLPIFYNIELETRYKELRDCGLITPEHISSLVIDWMDRVGNKETFEKEWERWSQFIKNDNIHRLYKWLNVSIANMDLAYHYSI